ncbi:MAG: TonB-dependent receptor domain-containing protein [Luminiphilus sp.]
MKLVPSALFRVLLPGFVLFSSAVNAADELVVYVFSNGTPVAGAEITVDGDVVGRTRSDGSITADLSSGGHAVSVDSQSGVTDVVRFGSNSGQLADVIFDLGSGDSLVEVHSVTEAAVDRRDAKQGTLAVRVIRDGQPQAGIIVNVSGEGVAATDADGIIQKTVPRGLYTISAEGVARSERAVAGTTRAVTLVLESQQTSMEAPSLQLEEVFVTGTFDPSGFEISERDTTGVVDTIGVELLSRYSDSDVASSVVRVPGISVQDNKYIFIRGLGGRYVAATLNNSTMPSTNPSKRTVPLDLFPSSFVSQLDIKKTFLPFMPGESTGGNLVINTKTFPDEPVRNISFGTGFVNGITSTQVATDPLSGEFDAIGWDDGTRERDVGVFAISQALGLGTVTDSNGNSYEISGLVEGELRRAGAVLIKDGFDIDTAKAQPNASFGLEYGDLFYVGDAELGFYAAANYSNEWSQRENGRRYSYTPTGERQDDLRYEQASNNVIASGLLSVGLNIGDSTFEWNTLLSRDTSSQVERSAGQGGDEFEALYLQTIQWTERTFASTQLAGSHFLNDDGSIFGEWQITASSAYRYAPDRRDFVMASSRDAVNATDIDAFRSEFDFGTTNDQQSVELRNFFIEPGAIIRRYDDLLDTNVDVSFDVTVDALDDGYHFSNFRFGASGIVRDRDSDSESYGFNINQARSELLFTDNLLVSDVIYVCGDGPGTRSCQPSVDADGSTVPPSGGITNSRNTGFVFQDKTLASDSYEAELTYNSAYLMYDHAFGSTWQVVAGGRYEEYEQITDTFSLSGAQLPVQSIIAEDSFLPSLSINWFFSDNQQLRFAASQTVARPDFKEAANATFYDNEFNFRVLGNPFLEVSTITNADVRWEWYGDNDQDNLSVALFYKDMEKPIERVVQLASGTAGNSRTFRNADSGELAGIELEGKKEFVLDEGFSKTLFVSFNVAAIESEVALSSGRVRELQGQPEYTANLVLGYDDIVSGQQLTLLLNQSGKSIADVGLFGAPDIIFEPRLEANLVYKIDLSEDLSVKAKLDNFLNAEVEYTQGGQPYQLYDKGTKFSVSVDWDL